MIQPPLFNVLSGTYETHTIDSVIDVSPTTFSNKWHKDKNVSLKVSTHLDSITKAKLMVILDYLSTNHKQHKHVMISSNKGNDVPLNVLIAFLALRKNKTMIDAANTVCDLDGSFVPDQEFIKTITKYKEAINV